MKKEDFVRKDEGRQVLKKRKFKDKRTKNSARERRNYRVNLWELASPHQTVMLVGMSLARLIALASFLYRFCEKDASFLAQTQRESEDRGRKTQTNRTSSHFVQRAIFRGKLAATFVINGQIDIRASIEQAACVHVRDALVCACVRACVCVEDGCRVV